MSEFISTTEPGESAAAAACGQCGTALPPDGVPGLCPRCEILLALEGPADADVSARGELGGYEMIEEAGRGGMGRVWKARQPGLGRLVAIKILPGGEWAGASMRLRFQREAEAAARLRHPHLVAVHDCGEHEGTLWYSMDFIEGESLADRLARGPLPPREAALMMEKVTRAVAFAHSQGVWHRDLKPGNILVDAAGEPHVTDFGLAHTEASTGLTLTGNLAGSPHYMPPERAGGDGKSGSQWRDGTAGGHDSPSAHPSARSPEAAGDIYALGATLYHVLTGSPPFSGPNVSAVLAKVLSDPPSRPSSLRPEMPRDLETICLKCLEKQPSRRYAAAEDLADDLKRFLDGEPVRARPIGVVARAARWAKRRPALAMLAAGLGITLAGLIGLMAWSTQRSLEDAGRFQAAAATAENAERAAQIESGIASARSARLSERFASRSEGLQSLARAAAMATGTARNQKTLRALRDEAAALLALPETDWSERVVIPEVMAGQAWWMERTRQWLMVQHMNEWFISKEDCTDRIVIPVTDAEFSTTCSPDRRYAATQPGPGASTFWRMTPPRAASMYKYPGGVVDWSSDGARALMLSGAGITVLEVESGKPLSSNSASFCLHAGRFNSDGTRAAVPVIDSPNTPAAQFALLVFDTTTGADIWRSRVPAKPAALAWSRDDAWIAAMDTNGHIQLYNATNGYPSLVLSQIGGAVQGPYTPGVEFTRDGFLASHSPRNTVALWDPASGHLLRTQIATGWHSGGIRDGIKYGPLATRRTHAAWLRITRGVWSAIAVPVNDEHPLSSLTWSPDGSRLAAVHEWGTWLYRLADQALSGPLSAPVAGDRAQTMEFLSDGSGLLASYASGLWIQAMPEKTARSLAVPVQLEPVRQAVLGRAAKGSLMAVAGVFSGGKSRLLLLNPRAPDSIRSTELAYPPVSLALNPDGTRILVGLQHHSDSLLLMDTADFRVIHAWPRLGGAPHAVDFDPLGHQFTYSVYNAHLGDLESGATLGDYSSWSQTDGIFGSPTAACDPSGRWLAVTDPPRRILLYRRAPVSAGAPHGWKDFLTLESPSGAGLTRLSFSPDGKHLAAATTRPTFELWDLEGLERELQAMGIWQ